MTTKVLVVEDERAAREGVRQFLEYSGFDVRAAADAEHAVSEAVEWPPDVLVCDWQLDGPEDGVDVATAIQLRHGCAVIFITSHPLEYLRGQARGLTVRGFLHKPVPLGVLAEAVRAAATTPANVSRGV
jgi:DNA-binding response OmpR family regulator